MKISQTIADAKADRATLGKLALVPTMGALHEGHLSLIRLAKQKAKSVAVSIFVNPTQFGPREDFSRYPRPLERDLELCEKEGVDLVFNPLAEEMYPTGSQPMTLEWPSLTGVLEGKFRPGHFSGVAQVVAKLFHILSPDVAIFGQKDFQQLRVIRELVNSLNFAVEVVAAPTLREPDGLAMSSRNVYLSESERVQALGVSKALRLAEAEAMSGVKSGPRLMTTMKRTLLEKHLQIDYVTVVDPDTLKEVETVTGPIVLAVAVRAGNTRLIDNVLVEPPV
jgi:pantoate--beta-alanine ligase